MKTQVYFRFREHPGDLFRSTDIVKLPDAKLYKTIRSQLILISVFFNSNLSNDIL